MGRKSVTVAERQRGGAWLLALVLGGGLALAVLPLVVQPPPNTQRLVMRAAPLLGYQALFLSIAVAARPERVRPWLGVGFLPLHHFFAKAGLLLMLAHAAAVALDFGTASVLLPAVEAPRAFLQWGGSPALAMVLASTSTAYFAHVFRRTWRPLHLATYAAFYLASAHGLMLGGDLQRPVAKVLILCMVTTATIVLLWRQWRAFRRGRA